MKDVVFLTGATGFLGTQIALRLIKKDNMSLIVLVRGKNFDAARRHLFRAWWEWPELVEEVQNLKKIEQDHMNKNKVYLVVGDISKEKLGLKNIEYNYLVDNITHIIHTAADLRLNSPIEDLRIINVKGTRNIVKLGLDAHNNHGIKRFSHLSTAYVAGKQKDFVSEDSLTDNYGFLSNYEKSKYEGELKVRKSGLPISVFRPGMVVGDSESGYVKTFNTIYVLLRLYFNGKLRFIPVSPKVKINLVPVDYVADSVVELTFDRNSEDLTFHLTAPYSSLPTVTLFINAVRIWANNKLDLKLPKPIFLPVSQLIPKITFILKFLGTNSQGISKTITELAPYLNENRKFSRNNIERLSGPYKFHWEKFLPTLLNYAIYNGFFHRSERTVHEQILFRLKSKNKPIKYIDVVNGRFQTRKSDEIIKDILCVVKSLKALDIGPGDRLAIIGFNNTRYLTMDISIGLLGAVSVPIYYTSPVTEINEIIKNCEAKIIFIGTPQLINQLNELETNNQIVSFCRDIMELPANVLSWKEFLRLEMESESSKNYNPLAPVDFNDIATIRYTSGTTGKPSGVTFTHGNLRWMAEYIASMPPWIDRTHKVSYLSFLPMNHVVEGILGTYAPYYAPASLNLCFLEDFKDLESTLPKVRPTIFFSVPRFYEKVWSKLSQSWMGSMYLKTREGSINSIIRIILRKAVLKQSGLDACAQLIVGSAPVSAELLKSYQELGIEIHNAYGLTEAPLVTINKLGFNRIGTVGEPLPNTEVQIEDDGEVTVRGPQVTSGYFNDNNRNDLLFHDDWLLTGDYGKITSEGSLVITGRKKELIVNSYGKSISPLKIEEKLKHKKGITEVMVVGDEKPYCIALIWVEDELNPNEIANDIKDLNSKLSHPEKIKRWAILINDLSIENGDLTANHKLKRSNILKRLEDLIHLIYDRNCRDRMKNELKGLKIIQLDGEGKNNEY